jgi:hypothetical protein
MAFALALVGCESDKGDGTSTGAQDAAGGGGGGSGGAGGEGGGGSGGTGGTGGSQAAADCPSRCGAVATSCGAPAEMCASACPTLSESQLVCLEGAGCDYGAIQTCLTTTGSSGSGNPGGSGGSGNPGGSGGSGDAGGSGGEADAGGSTTDPCFGLGAGCIHDEFFSKTCESSDPARPYYLACCEATPDASQDCVGEPGKGYCCASK